MSFDTALAFTLSWEGGKVDLKEDKGGRTNKGIIQRTYEGWRVSKGYPKRDVWLASDSEIRQIYFTRFWRRAFCDHLYEPLDMAIFDTAVLHGEMFARKRLQLVLGVEADGIYGGKTWTAILAANPLELTEKFLQARDDRYEALVAADPTQKMFYKGWERRCDALCDACGVPRTKDPV